MTYITRCNPSCICLDQPHDIRISSIELVDHAAHSTLTWILNLTEPTADVQNDEQAPAWELDLGTTLIPNAIWEYHTNKVDITCTGIKAFLNAVDCADLPPDAFLCCRIPPFSHYSDPLGTSQCILYADARAYLEKLPEFGCDPPLPDSPVCPYVVRNSQLGGRGIFAKRDLNVGDLIMVERPLIVMPLDLLQFSGIQVHPDVDQDYSSSTRDSLFNEALQLAFNHMNKKNRKVYMKLYNAFPDSGQPELNGILDTNSFTCGQMGPTRETYYPTYKTLARLNHSCKPNSTALFDQSSFSEQHRATRPIRENEEIFITYQSIMLHPIAKERQDFFEGMGFRCPNSCCLDSSDLAHSSMASLYDHVSRADKKKRRSIYAQFIHTRSTLLLLWMSAKGLDGLEHYASVLLMHVKAAKKLSELVATTREKENLEREVKMWEKLSDKYKLAYNYE